MLVPGDPHVDEMLELAHLATSASFNDRQRSRWRALCSEMLSQIKSGGAASERRRAVRGTASLQVSVLSPQAQGTAVTSTVSASGLSLRSERAAAVGEALEIAISIPERRSPLRVLGEVVWSRGGELGVSLRQPSLEASETLEAVAVKALLVYGALE